ncbi:MAG: PF20097 family protein [Anaerostipes hadrus]
MSAESVKLTSLLTKTYVEAYLCRDCNKIIIDINQT